ncbi:acyltransferase family protein [Paraburkholderia pallida]|uniref:Acyltransferase n=1 Tax=Paraburkholderia pallida TaxID=2547399 RepID=A0A4P7CR98_9BURK|nr:acyltransferase [Paraburkholderia pallida]QBQ98410.1 acyltransferase [Paraburkholderia pallida]
MSLLSNALSRERNNFDLVRLLAASAVVFAHSFVLQPFDGHRDPATVLLGFDYSGSLGVFAFFLLSGLLVTASYDRQRSATRFLILRAARIWPAIAVASLVAIFIIGPLLTTWSLKDYFASGLTWGNLDTFSVIVIGKHIVLPGVFEHNHRPNMIYEPLWTLPIEVRYYAVVLGTGVLGLLKSRRGMLVAVLLGTAPFLIHPYLEPHFHLTLRNLANKPGGPNGYAYFPELVFMTGMLLYAWRDRVHISGWAAAALIFGYAALRGTPLAQPVFYAAFAYGVLWIGTTPLLHRFAPRNDYSFGIYVYGFAIQQVVAYFGPNLDHLSALFIAVPGIFACAYVSWHCVEQPALEWTRRRLAKARKPAQETDRMTEAAARQAPTQI